MDKKRHSMAQAGFELLCLDNEDNETSPAEPLLRHFPVEDARSVVLTLFKSVAVVRSPGNEVTILIGGKEDTVALSTTGNTEFFVQLLAHGLTLSTVDYDTLSKCVAVCCEWAAALIADKSACLPHPIVERHDFYLDVLLTLLVDIFRIKDAVKQPLLCHLVLRRIEETVHENMADIRSSVWRKILLFSLRIANIIFKTVGPGLPEVSHRAATVFTHLWLAACVSCFPSPDLWNTLTAYLPRWRHSEPMLSQWGLALVWLTQLQVRRLYPDRPPLVLPAGSSCSCMSVAANQQGYWSFLASEFERQPDILAETWFRILHASGRPADLCRPGSFLLSTVPKASTLTSSEQHKLPLTQDQLNFFARTLPTIFHSSIHTLACVVDLLLGLHCIPFAGLHLVVNQPDVLDESQLTITSSTGSSLASAISQRNKSARTKVGQVLAKPTIGRPVSVAGIVGSLTHSSIPSSTSSIATLGSSSGQLSNLPPSATLPNGVAMGMLQLTNGCCGSSSHSTSQMAAILVQVMPSKRIRPAVATLMNLVGTWLLDAAAVAFSETPSVNATDPLEAAVNAHVLGGSTDSKDSQQLTKLFGAGLAEALGCLCRLLSAYRNEGIDDGRKFAPFYSLVNLSLSRIASQPLLVGSIFLNGAWGLFHGQLPGITSLVENAAPAGRIAVRSTDPRILHAALASCCAIAVLPGGTTFGDRFVNVLLSSLTAVADGVATTPLDLETLQLQLATLLCLLNGINGVHTTHMSPKGTVGSSTNHASAVAVVARLLVGATMASRSTEQLPVASTTASKGDSKADRTSSASMSGISSSGFSGSSGFALGPGGVLLPSYAQSMHAPSKQLCILEFLTACAPIVAPWPANLTITRSIIFSLCQAIEAECCRPPTEHSRDLHTAIVAAYGSLSTWVSAVGVGSSGLLTDKELFERILSVVELGLVGVHQTTTISLPPIPPGSSANLSTSTPNQNQNTTTSSSSLMQSSVVTTSLPVSRRVQLGAQSLLHAVVASPPISISPSSCRPFSTSCCVDEPILIDALSQLRQSNSQFAKQALDGNATLSPNIASTVRHYSLGDGIIASVIPVPTDDEQVTCASSVILLIRNQTGRYCWLFSLVPPPQASTSTTQLSVLVGSTFSPPGSAERRQLDGTPTNSATSGAGMISFRRFLQPQGVDHIPYVNADLNLPRSISGTNWNDSKHEALRHMMTKEVLRTAAKTLSLNGNGVKGKSSAASSTSPLWAPTAGADRLILAHLGFYQPHLLRSSGQDDEDDTTSNDPNHKSVPLNIRRVAPLELTPVSGTPSALSVIDSLADRLVAVIWCFYCKKGATGPDLTLTISASTNVSPLFWELLEGVAWPRPVVSNSCTVVRPPYDGTDSVLYWADTTSSVELTILTPSPDRWPPAPGFGADVSPTAVLCYLEDPDDREVVMPRLQAIVEQLLPRHSSVSTHHQHHHHHHHGGATGPSPPSSSAALHSMSSSVPPCCAIPQQPPACMLISPTGSGAFRLLHVVFPTTTTAPSTTPTNASTATVSSVRPPASAALVFAGAAIAPGGLVVARRAAPVTIRQAIVACAVRSHLMLSATAPAVAELMTPASRRQQRLDACRRAAAIDLSEPDFYARLLMAVQPTLQQATSS